MEDKKPASIGKKRKIAVSAAVVSVFALFSVLAFGSGMAGKDGAAGVQGAAKAWILSLVEEKAQSAKAELELLCRDIQAGNTESARLRAQSLSKELQGLRKPLNRATFLLQKAAPAKAKRLEDAAVLLTAADLAMEEILFPALDLMEQYPISGLKMEEGFNTGLIGHYLDFAETVMPKAEEALKAVNSVDLSFLKGEMGEYLSYLDTANRILAFCNEDPSLIPMIKDMIGAEEDRLYVIAVQNPSEIRASGGFPGSVGTMKITDGVLRMGEFKSVTYMFSAEKPREIQITPEERQLFYHLSGIQTPRDSDLCPDFERVGHIWALAYENMHGETVDGVISVTPHIVQRMLAVMDEEIELSDGTVLNGENARKVLLYDIYFKYFGKDFVEDRNAAADQLFAEAAKKTMEKLTENAAISRLLQYFPVMDESIRDRTLMLWMKDPREQSFVKQMRWSGGLNDDPENPAAGVYVNCIFASKMGWFFLMDTYIGERTRNEDGSYTYPVTVTFVNSVTREEIQKASKYILGGMSGAIKGAAYFFPPAGGSVSNFELSSGRIVKDQTYNGYALGFLDGFTLYPDEPLVITYSVTTAPGMETPLTFSKTPTAQDYRETYGK